MAETNTVSITKTAWTEVTGTAAGMLMHIQGRFAFYVTYSDAAPTLSDPKYLVEDNRDTPTSSSEFIGICLGKAWVLSKDQDQDLTITTGDDTSVGGYSKASAIEVTISSGQTTSAAIDLKGKHLVAIAFPAAFTGTTVKLQNAATIAGTYREVNELGSGAAYLIPASVSDQQPVDLWVSYGLNFVKVVSSASEGASRTLYLIVK